MELSDSVDSEMLRVLLEAGGNPFYSRDFADTQMDCPLLLLLKKPLTLKKNLDHFISICPADKTRIVKALLQGALSRGNGITVEVSFPSFLSCLGPLDLFLLLAVASRHRAHHVIL